MRKIGYIIIVLIFCACENHFEVWKEFNEGFLHSTTAEKALEVAPSGLRHRVIFQGKGALPKTSSLVKIRYSATMGDGAVCAGIDTINYVYNFPIGLQEALLKMNRESIWTLCLPQEIAFGESGTKNSYGNYEIPPYSTIYFSFLELVEVENR